ncbi:MAG: hypothetical protein P1Q69_05610 [Candidatus Thorarchaeota archaeon]|nr:hypothetical protein [Candidatus Thorarchaeota archaeon]
MISWVEFDEPDNQQYHIDFTSQDCRDTWLRYAWNYRSEGETVTHASSANWVLNTWTSIGRDASQSIPTDVGQMLPVDLNEHKPRYSIETQKLKDMERRYIDYAGYGGEATTLANPITLLADSHGGGVVSYGLSTPISYDHVISNSSLTSVFMQMIAARNTLNLWGYSPKKQAVIDTRIGVTQWDQIEVMAKEGWMDRSAEYETPQSFVAARFEDTTGTPVMRILAQRTYSTSMTHSAFDSLLKKWLLGMVSTIQCSMRLSSDPQVPTRWVEFDLNTTDLDMGAGPYYVEARLVMGETSIWKNITIDLQSRDTIRFDLDQLFGEGDLSNPSLWTSEVGASSSMEERDAYNSRRDLNTLLYEGSATDPVSNTPLLVTAIYKVNPTTLHTGDISALLQNLVYYDYLKLSINHDYAREYENKWAEMEVHHAYLKPIMIAVGIPMVGAGALACSTGGLSFVGAPSILFGMDMITSNTVGESVLDAALKGLLYGATSLRGVFTGEEAQFILEDGFSFFQFTSNQAINLLLTQITFMIIGGLITGGPGLISAIKDGIRDTPSSWAKGSVAFLTKATYWGKVGLRYALGQFEHLVTGIGFLFALGAIGSIGEFSLFADIALQAIMCTSVVTGTIAQRMQKNIKFSTPESSTLKEFALEHIPYNMKGTFSRIKAVWSALRSARVEYLGHKAYYGTLTIAFSLQLASELLQLATIAGSAFV